ncbi:hypothetical protein SKAU_G00258050 [Synaphobranchus kaupii]|uniref:Uncharacterized protein n=1 Tax=Synaphobranchus kaupii TaxID=118154 RepID=A0A9Q1ISJ0_SYNKA|nr:hypothetical protein SKAU_G00258050 [Synaphobranchus kaupii]
MAAGTQKSNPSPHPCQSREGHSKPGLDRSELARQRSSDIAPACHDCVTRGGYYRGCPGQIPSLYNDKLVNGLPRHLSKNKSDLRDPACSHKQRSMTAAPSPCSFGMTPRTLEERRRDALRGGAQLGRITRLRPQESLPRETAREQAEPALKDVCVRRRQVHQPSPVSCLFAPTLSGVTAGGSHAF